MRSPDAFLRPSGAYRWLNCPASPSREAEYEQTTSPYAEEGTAAHELAAECLNTGTMAVDYLGEEFNGHKVTTEMVHAVQRYLDYVNEQPGDLLVEQKLDLSGVLPNDGTGDAIRLDYDTETIYINDLKYGSGVRVDAEDNPQLLTYAVGAVESYEWMGEFQRFELNIVQPRLDHIDTWVVSIDDVLAFRDVLRKGVAATRAENPEHVAGDHCRFCAARADCRAFAEYAVQTVASQFEDLTDFEIADPNTLPPDTVNVLLSRLPMMRAFATALEERATAGLLDGTLQLADWKIVEGRANRRWRDEDAVLEALKGNRKLKADDYAPRKLVTAPQLEKLVGKDMFNKKFADQVEKPKGKPTLAPAADKRPSVTPSDQFEDLDDNVGEAA